MSATQADSRHFAGRTWPPFLHRYAHLIDALWLVLLAAYALAGVPLNAFHTDETAHIINSLDYADVFFRGDLMSLPVDDAHGSWRSFTRLLDSTVSRYSFGLAWHLAGASEDELPTMPYSLRVAFEDSYADGRLPSERVLNASRTASVLFFVLSIGALYALARLYGSRPLAYLVTSLYALNPVMLINARRAMQEGSLMGFGMLVILVAAVIVHRQSTGRGVDWRGWLALALASGFALLSKNSALLFIAAAFGWILASEWLQRWPRLPVRTAAILGGCGALMVGLYVLLSPGLWSDPIGRLGDVAALRASEMTRITGNVDGPTPLAWRVENTFTQTYLRDAEYADTDAFRSVPAIAAQAAIYADSPLAGLSLGPVFGLLATLLALFGLAVICLPQLRPPAPEALYLGIPIWLTPVVLSLLVNPLPFQRYFLPLIPITSLLTGFGAYGIFRLVTVGKQAFTQPGVPFRSWAAAVLVVLLGAAFAYSSLLHVAPEAQWPPVLAETLPTSLRAIQARIEQDSNFAVRLYLSGVEGSPVVLGQDAMRLASAEAEYFCLEQADNLPVCFRYSSVLRLEVP